MLDQPISVLLIEDNPADVRYAQETLREFKLRNTLAIVRDGEEALAYLRKDLPYIHAATPDLVLLDVSLPKLDGIEVLAEIRSDPALAHLPVVILTSSRLDEQSLREYNIPVDCVVMKPLSLERLLDAVKCFPQFGLSIVRLASA